MAYFLRVPADRRCTVTLLAFLSTLSAQAHAQNPQPEMQNTRSARGRADLNSLSGALTRVLWNPESRGVLLVVDPQDRYKPRFFINPEHPPQMPAPLVDSPQGISIRDIGRRFERRVVALGTVTTLAHERMIEINARPKGGQSLASLTRDERMRLLLASLSTEQWKILGSENGLGASDLPPDQQALFVGLFSPNMTYRQFTYAEGQNHPNVGNEMPVSAAQIRGIRLRVGRSLTFMFPQVGSDNSYYHADRQYLAGRRSYLQLSYTPEINPVGAAYGVVLRSEVSNRLKVSDINWDAPALQTRIPMADINTVGELVERIATATGSPIRIDARLRGLPVLVRGEQARAGELLKAICWSISGAVRRVQGNGKTIYLLTDDVEGIHTRLARISDWARVLGFEKNRFVQEIRSKIQASKPLQFLRFNDVPGGAEGQLFAQNLDAERNKRGGFGGLRTVGMDQVPKSMVPGLRNAVAALNAGQPTTRVDDSRVAVQSNITWTFRIPGVGDITAEPFGGSGFNLTEWELLANPAVTESDAKTRYEKKLVEDASRPIAPNLKSFVFACAPTTPESATEWVLRARNSGATDIIVQLDGSERDQSILDASIKAGKESGIGVIPSISLLAKAIPSENSVAAPEPEAAETNNISDRTVSGEPLHSVARRYLAETPKTTEYEWESRRNQRLLVEWIRPDPTSTTTAREYAVRIAQTPGIAGLHLRNFITDGYTDDGAQREYGMASQLGNTALGYSPEYRIEFLEKEGIDPVDIFPPLSFGSVQFEFPLYRDQDATYEYVDGQMIRKDPPTRPASLRWNAFRYAKSRAGLTELYSALKKSAPTLPVYAEAYSSDSMTASWIGTWDKADTLPRYTWNFTGTTPPLSREKQARGQSQRILLVQQLGTSRAPTDTTRIELFLRAALANATAWDGVFFDLSDPESAKWLKTISSILPGGPMPTLSEASSSPATQHP